MFLKRSIATFKGVCLLFVKAPQEGVFCKKKSKEWNFMSNQNDQSQNQSPHWVDKITDGIIKWQSKKEVEKLHVDDMKTPSGRVHTGSLRGVMLHDLVARVLAEKTDDIKSTWVFNDMDPMDGLPGYLDQDEYQQHMGKPLCKIPAPPLDKSGIDFSLASDEEKKSFENANSFAEFYAIDFVNAFQKLGCKQEVIWSHDLYESGQMDDVIREALDKTEEIKKVYKEVADYDLPENWHPFQVTCSECGKVGTTLVTGWDGQEVSFECQKNKVEWAQGCGHKAKISPFGGTGKLLWKVDWPAHWKVMGVTVEGAGKDHTTAGGSRDMANNLLDQVLNSVVPFDIPYEWILIRGAKMSSSKGVGTSAREFVNLFPSQVARFLFVNKHYNQVIDFDPRDMTIPDLYDEYDQAARIYWGEEEGDQRMARSFELSQIGDVPEKEFLPRFRDVATWMQHPEIDLIAEFEKIKGSEFTKVEKNTLEITKKYAQIWLDTYAPEEFQLTMTKEIPEKSKELSSDQKIYLKEINELVDSKEWDPQDLQQQLFEVAKKSLGARQGFQAIYLAFLGKKSGPRAAWFLLSIDKEKRSSRINNVS